MKKIISAVLAAAIALTLCTAAYARLVGDVNGDGTTNSGDALVVLQYSVGSIDKINEKAADVNEDKNINSSDALVILQISVGSYTGPTEIEDDVLVTSLKKDNVDPILKSGKFTLTTTVISEGNSIPTTIMVNGNDLSADINYSGINCRMLILSGQCYLIFPKLRVYGTVNSVPSITIAGTAKEEYVGSKYYEHSGKTYVVETYKSSDGSSRDYYFLDGTWVTLVTTAADGTVSTQRIDLLKAGVTDANFSLKGYIKVADLSDYI